MDSDVAGEHPNRPQVNTRTSRLHIQRLWDVFLGYAVRNRDTELHSFGPVNADGNQSTFYLQHGLPILQV